ncbi:MAG TPA: patatin-like phospholipase family protein [Solirubrobacteraceae bacterium]|nr:patatin-like phospholipase family protein [Solirubrobacteraceae bacterium]
MTAEDPPTPVSPAPSLAETKPLADLVVSAPAPRAASGPQPGIALCLSGGGYRAMLFHVGALWRLLDAGVLARVDRVSSVSGGSITAATLALAWPELRLEEVGANERFQELVVAPLRGMACKTIDVPAVLWGILIPWRTVSGEVARRYAKRLFPGGPTLQELPERPRFVINATNLQSTALWRFSRPYARDYLVGEIEHPRLKVAAAVAASSAFPPFLSPARPRLAREVFASHPSDELTGDAYRRRPILSDGGVYDNLGLETAWKRYRTVLVSDGGGKTEPQAKVARDWLRQSYRVLNVIDNQVRSLRKRALIASYRDEARTGAYWGIRTNIANYRLENALPCPVEQTTRLAQIPTRLAKLDPVLQQRLINWGYAVCDAALRAHYEPKPAPPRGFPYPEAGVGSG